MEHAVAIGADDGQILEPHRPGGCELGKWDPVVALREPGSELSVALLKVEPTHLAREPTAG